MAMKKFRSGNSISINDRILSWQINVDVLHNRNHWGLDQLTTSLVLTGCVSALIMRNIYIPCILSLRTTCD